MIIPEKFNRLRQRILKTLSPIIQSEKAIKTAGDCWFSEKLLNSEQLPPYYVIHFLFVELLGFKKFGHFEKVSWTIPLEYEGVIFSIEHRKFGVGAFCEAHLPKEILSHIQRRINTSAKMARPFLDWIASQAIDSSLVNVYNKGLLLFSRYTYLKKLFTESRALVKNEISLEEIKLHPYMLYWHNKYTSEWLASASIDSFFSWTEHVFILIAILSGKITTAGAVSQSAISSWPAKFKAIFELSDDITQKHYERLMALRSEIRNYQAHGAFGKDGEAFEFHSSAGAVPAVLPHKGVHKKFIIKNKFGMEEYDNDAAFATLERFIDFMWSGDYAPAFIYIQESDLPLILSLAEDGTYTAPMESERNMKELVEKLSREFERAANMDW